MCKKKDTSSVLDRDPVGITALELVQRHNGAFGRRRLGEVLAGRATAAVQAHDLHRDPAFGAAADLEASPSNPEHFAGGRLTLAPWPRSSARTNPISSSCFRRR